MIKKLKSRHNASYTTQISAVNLALGTRFKLILAIRNSYPDPLRKKFLDIKLMWLALRMLYRGKFGPIWMNSAEEANGRKT